MKSTLVVLVMTLLFVAHSVDIHHADNEQPPPEPDQHSGNNGPGNIHSEVNEEEIYDHGEEIPFDYTSYTKQVDTNNDGLVSFEEH